MLRNDIEEAIRQAPPEIQADLRGQAADSVAFLSTHLAEDETVTVLSSAAVRGSDNVPLNCALALTNRRLIFVAPRPQAIALRLQSITKFQTSFGDPAYLFLNGDGREYSLGIPQSYRDELAKLVHPAVAAAVIADA